MIGNIWGVLEWLGALTALSGTLVLATQKLKPTIPWVCWLVSNICYMIYFSHFGQTPLLLMNVFGFFINVFGYYQWVQHEKSINPFLTKVLLTLSISAGVIAIIYIISFILSPSNKFAESFGSALGVAAAFLLSSRHKYSFLCWFIWSLSNVTILFVTSLNHQYGVAFLQTGFMMINIFGAITWIKNFRITHAFEPLETPSQP